MSATRQVELDSLLTQVQEALVAGDWKQAAAQLEALRPPDQADLFRKLSPAEQDRLLPHLNLEDSADILEALEEEESAKFAERLDTATLARILDEMVCCFLSQSTRCPPQDVYSLQDQCPLASVELGFILQVLAQSSSVFLGELGRQCDFDGHSLLPHVYVMAVHPTEQ